VIAPPTSVPGVQAAFSFKGKGLLAIAELLISLVFAMPFILIEHSRTGLPSVGEVVLALIVLSFVLAAILDIRQTSDIVADDQYISRRLFGWSWQTIPWNRIRLIKVIPFFHPVLRKIVRIISIYPSGDSRPRLLPLTKMAFFDQAKNMNELIAIINHHAAINHVKIESSGNGVMTSIPAILG
jgi:hypothetical protein